MTLDLNTIKQDLEQWVVNYLDVPSEFYNGNKPCPFALKSWTESKVRVVLGEAAEVERQIAAWDDSCELLIVVCDHEAWSSNDWVREKNTSITGDDLYLMSFDPDDSDPDDPSLDPHEWGSITEDVYGMVFLQRLTNLNAYSEKLKPTGYYENVSRDFMTYVNERKMTCVAEAKQPASDHDQ